MPRPVLVELLGLPGSGKTTVTRTAMSRLETRDVNRPYFYGRDGKHESGIADLILFLSQLSRAAGAALRAGRPGTGIRRLQRFLPAIEKTLVFRRVRRRHGGDPVVLFDQGPIQMLYLLGRTDVPNREEMLALMELLRPDLAEVAVFVDTPPEVAARRYFARAKTSSRRPYKDWDEARITALYGAHVPVIRWIAEWLETATDTRVVRLDGRQSVQYNGAILARAIEEAGDRVAPTTVIRRRKTNPGRS